MRQRTIPNLVLAKQELAALQAQLQKIAGSQRDTGSDINLSKGRVTQAGMEYIRRYRDLKYQETVFELLAKEFEIAKLDEAREGSIIQVVDPAVPPDKISWPPRVLILVATPIMAFLIAVFWVWMRKNLARSFEITENRATSGSDQASLERKEARYILLSSRGFGML